MTARFTKCPFQTCIGILGLVGCIGLSAGIPGCVVGPQPTEIAATKQLPADWMKLSETDWRLAALPKLTRDYLAAVRENMAIERSGSYYQFYGRYTDPLLKHIAEANDLANTAFLVSSKQLNSSLTPELYGTAETFDDANWHYADNANQTKRQLQDDWGRFWLTDSPSKLSPFPITNTSGQP